MKKVLFLILVFSIIISCKKEDELTIHKLHGTWLVTNVKSYTDDVLTYETSDYGTFTFDFCEINNIEFCNGFYHLNQYQRDFPFLYNFKDENSIIIYENGYNKNYNVTKLSRKEMVLENIVKYRMYSGSFTLTTLKTVYTLEKQ